jgi:hypothetical protein
MMDKLLYRLPRMLGILFAIFITIFALDVFEEGVPLRESLPDFLIHIIPTYILILILLIAWKWELVGGFLYLFACAFYLILMRPTDWIAVLLIGGPLLLIGILFIVSSRRTKKKEHVSFMDLK